MKRTDDRALAEALFDGCLSMTLAMTEASGSPYCVPLSPARQGNALYIHCALSGRKVDALRANPKVCLSCVGDSKVVPGEFTIAYASAIAFGTAYELTDIAEKTAALRLICEKYCAADMWDFDRVLESYLPATGIWKIELDEITTKS